MEGGSAVDPGGIQPPGGAPPFCSLSLPPLLPGSAARPQNFSASLQSGAGGSPVTQRLLRCVLC